MLSKIFCSLAILACVSACSSSKKSAEASGDPQSISQMEASKLPPVPKPAPTKSATNAKAKPEPTYPPGAFVPVLPDLQKERLVPLAFSKDGFPRVKQYFNPKSDPQRLERVESDFNGDGRIDFTQWYDDQGEWVKKESADLDGDGRFDVNYYYKRSLANTTPTLYLAEYDTQYSGQADLWKHYSDGKLVRREFDRRGLGKPDYWEYYENGRLIRIEKDENADGRPDSQPSFRAIVKPRGPEPGKDKPPKSSAR